jgi:CheY-like chemotaxis protein
MNFDSPPKIRPIYVIDDDQDAGVLIKHLLRECQMPNPLRCVLDSGEALRLLRGLAEGDDAVPPLLILVDLKMPRLDGFELLGWLNSCAEFAGVPRVVLSSSLSDKDVEHAYALGASGFLTKYPSPNTFAAIAHAARENCPTRHDVKLLGENLVA